MTVAQPLKWHGGKAYLADWIISLMPPHLHYVEPYFGGGAVLLARDPNRNWMAVNGGEKLPAHLSGCSEVVNDINGRLTNFWSVLGSAENFTAFARRVQAVPMSQELWRDAVSATEFPDFIEDAVQFFIRYRQSRQGLGKDFATLSRNRTRGGRNEQANAWLNCIEGLPEIQERFKGVVILNDDAVKVIKQQDGEQTLFYCDPPYVHETRSSVGEYGEHEMTLDQHKQLLTVLSAIQGKFILSGYHSSLYDNWAIANGFQCHEREIDNKASSKKQKDKRVECLWTNHLAGQHGMLFD